MDNEIKILESTNREDYEILLRKRGKLEYAAYCPQINYMIKGEEHQEVKSAMETYINEHIETIRDMEKVSEPIQDDLSELLIEEAESFELDEIEDMEFDSEDDVGQVENG